MSLTTSYPSGADADQAAADLGLGVPGAAGPRCERERADLAFTNPKEFERLAVDARRKPGLSGLSDPDSKEI
jgi:hypothetical protein